MTINEIIQQNEELQLRYARALNTITILERKLEKLQKENQRLAEENKKLRKLNNILYRAMEIALQIHNAEAQYRHLKAVLERIKQETGEFKG
jgi:FtsZ-binding cell division protein ZapB